MTLAGIRWDTLAALCVSLPDFSFLFFFLTSSSPPFFGRGDGLQLISWPIPTAGFSCTTAR